MRTDLDRLRLTDSRLLPVAEKVIAEERLDREDGILVATTDDLLGVGRLANLVRERLHGDRTNCTMLYGHIETAPERVDHLLALRALQDETEGFQCLIPLAFHPENTALDHLPSTGGRLDLQTIATSRLVLDNVPHLKAYWIMLGEKVAQVALQFGADDLDGTIVDERITFAAGGTAGRGISRARLEHLIRETGRVPTLRDTLYRVIDSSTEETASAAAG